jgi:hypothetical protein
LEFSVQTWIFQYKEISFTTAFLFATGSVSGLEILEC